MADSSLTAHVITVEVTSQPRPSGECFKVSTERYNPAAKGTCWSWFGWVITHADTL